MKKHYCILLLLVLLLSSCGRASYQYNFVMGKKNGLQIREMDFKRTLYQLQRP